MFLTDKELASEDIESGSVNIMSIYKGCLCRFVLACFVTKPSGTGARSCTLYILAKKPFTSC